MPTVYFANGYRIWINSHDHTPPHCHVDKEGFHFTINLDDYSLLQVKGVKFPKSKYIREASIIVEQNADLLKEVWNKYHDE